MIGRSLVSLVAMPGSGRLGRVGEAQGGAKPRLDRVEANRIDRVGHMRSLGHPIEKMRGFLGMLDEQVEPLQFLGMSENEGLVGEQMFGHLLDQDADFPELGGERRVESRDEMILGSHNLL